MSSIVSPTIVLAGEGRAVRRVLPWAVAVAAIAGGTMPWLVGGWSAAVAAPISAGLTLVIAVAAWRAGLTGSRYRVDGGSWLPDGSWRLHLADGRLLDARLDTGVRALAGLWVLVWHSSEGRYFRLIGRGQGDRAHETRRLAVRLRMEWAECKPEPGRPA